MLQIDHVVAGAILVVSVLQAFADPEALKRAPRLAFYRAGAATGAVMGLMVLLAWYVAGRPIAEFGLFRWSGTDLKLTAAIALAWPLALLAVAHLVRTRFGNAAAGYYRRFAHLMPTSRAELGAAYSAGILAAVGEEIAFRGFMIWYLVVAAGFPGAVVVSSLIFGSAHGYQGRLGMAFATAAGLVLAGAYLLTGSLMLAVWMHATYNLASFTLGYRLLRAEQQQATAST